MTPFEWKAVIAVLVLMIGACHLLLAALAVQRYRGPRDPEIWTGTIAGFGSHVELQGTPTPHQVDYLSQLMNRPLRSAFEWPRWGDHQIDPSQDPYYGTRKDWRAHA